jgi:hypothetical protein
MNLAPHPSVHSAILAVAVVIALTSPESVLMGADLVHARDGSGVYGYKDTPVLPWCGFHVHDPDRPAPVPSDATVLFAGPDLSVWQSNAWRVVDGVIEAGAGNLATKESFGDMQLHLEWLAPANYEGPWYNRGNNGVLLMGLYEIQIFDSYNEKLYPDGQTAAIYGQTPPRVNASRPPGQWQTFDIVFTAPKWEGDRLASPARVTLFHNGVLVHLEEEIRGETNHRVLPEYRSRVSRGPLVLGGHDCPVRFRNIWVRPL